MSRICIRHECSSGRLHNEEGQLWLDHSKRPKRPPDSFAFPLQPQWLNMPLLLLGSQHAACRPQQHWQLVHCLLSSLCCHCPLGNILQVNWHLTALVWCGRRGVVLCFGSHLYPQEAGSFGPFGPHCMRTVRSISCPLLRLFLPVSPPSPARLHAWQTDRCYLPCISSSGPLSLSTNSPLLAHRLQIPSASLPVDKGQYQWQNIFYVWNVAHNKQSSIRFV